MRVIENSMVRAWTKKENFKRSNTEVSHLDGVTRVYLFGHLIAIKDADGARFSLAGYNTVTTRSRLRALGCGVYCKNGVPMRDGQPWRSDF